MLDAKEKHWFTGHLAPLLAAVCAGTVFAILAIVSQGGSARGYTSVLLLFVSGGLAILGIAAGVVALVFRKFGTAFELVASAIILPTTFQLVLFVVRTFNGERIN